MVYEAGGADADLSELIQEGIQDFSKDIGPYLLAGMGQFLVVVPVSFAAGLVAYFGSMLGMMGGWIVGLVLGLLLASLGDVGAFLGALVMVGLPFLGLFAVLLPILPVMVAILAPVNASLVRAVAAHQRGEKELSLGSAFETLTEDVGRVIVTALVLTGFTMVGLLFCYVGALLVPILFGFVSTLVALHRCGPIEAFRLQIAHLRKHGNTHLMLGVGQIAFSMVAGFVPVIGPLFLVDMQVRAHRKMFGDGPTPVVT
jgi:hypothetical protein